MYDSITLVKAIEANENGIKTLQRQRAHYVEEWQKATVKAGKLLEEIEARQQMSAAMVNLQCIYGDKETITFKVPV